MDPKPDKDYGITTSEVAPYILASAAVVILIVIVFIQRLRSSIALEKEAEARVLAAEQERGPPGLRRVAGARNRRNARLRQQDQGVEPPPARAAARAQRAEAAPPADDGNDSEGSEEDPQAPSGKIGAKKRRKLEMKAEKKAQRERELQEREEEKKKKAIQEEMQKMEEEKQKKLDAKQAEEERRFLEEKQRKEQEEYLKMKAMFSVEEEGYDKAGEDEEGNLLQEFIGYIKKEKVVYLEDLAAHFKLRTQEVIDRIKELQESGDLSGVTDDRGKYIYISQDELRAVAKFISQRGRVSIAELAESSNTLISLNSEIPPAETPA